MPPTPLQANELATAVCTTLRLARALVQSGRHVDLAGLDAEAGRLCVMCLGLPPEQGRAMRPRLAAMLAELGALTAVLHDAAP